MSVEERISKLEARASEAISKIEELMKSVNELSKEGVQIERQINNLIIKPEVIEVGRSSGHDTRYQTKCSLMNVDGETLISRTGWDGYHHLDYTEEMLDYIANNHECYDIGEVIYYAKNDKKVRAYFEYRELV